MAGNDVRGRKTGLLQMYGVVGDLSSFLIMPFFGDHVFMFVRIFVW
jgi:hypothetical protein